ncbi:amino acid/amide ABC transporter substrate-binding protein, HAAT family [Cyanobacterium stanieri PCC 7202]|uniref:Amino acid/amide ABC transporter substrate-binding protein, HAAT family n=1 Tax=Cyanobacterium stanieri (strain ATCC 29140 / PCC 7202) TaxID=292563 RepID=K9YLM6_CYASC|nr:amino acid/amide ABC transporter substrate-binding protein, HAAT family [Cyanobacterium stanieri PCC 7202]
MNTVLRPWLCDGKPQNDQEYPHCLGHHQPVENFGDICPICSLPREAGKSILGGVDNTFMEQNNINKKIVCDGENGFSLVDFLVGDKTNGDRLRLVILGAIIGFILTSLSHFVWNPVSLRGNGFARNNRDGFSADLISTGMDGGDLVSQGETIFFEVHPLKQSAADAFRLGHWQGAIASYQEYLNSYADDYEAQIYLQNAIARTQGNPITMAITTTNQAHVNLLSGIARYQQEFNQQQIKDNQRLLEIVMVNYEEQNHSLIQDILNANNIIGVLGYGLDAHSYDALSMYESQGMAVISPMNTTLVVEEGVLKKVTSQAMDDFYHTLATESLLTYADNLNSPPNGIIFYDSEDENSLRFKANILATLPSLNGRIIEQVDITQNSTPEEVLSTVTGANTIILALGNHRLSEAMRVLEENNYFLPVLGSHELFSNDTLIKGGSAVDQMVMALPFGFNPDTLDNGQFIDSWSEEQIYYILKSVLNAIAPNPNRGNLNKLLQEGIQLPSDYHHPDSLLQMPLVQIVPDFEGLSDTGYKFEVKNPMEDYQP